MTSDLDIYRSANELVKERGLKGASDYATHRRLAGADDIAAAKLEELTKLCLWLADFLEERKVRCLSDLEPRQ